MANLQVHVCESMLEKGEFQPNDNTRLPDDDAFVCLLRRLMDSLLDIPEHTAVLSGLAALLNGHFSPPGTRLDDAALVPARDLLRSVPITVVVAFTLHSGFGFHFRDATCSDPSGYICFHSNSVQVWRSRVARGDESGAFNLEFLLKATFLHELAHWAHTQRIERSFGMLKLVNHEAINAFPALYGEQTGSIASKPVVCDWREYAEPGFYLELCAFSGIVGYDRDFYRATITFCTHLAALLPDAYIQEVHESAFARFEPEQWQLHVHPKHPDSHFVMFEQDEVDLVDHARCTERAQASFFPSEDRSESCDAELYDKLGAPVIRLKRDCTGTAMRRILHECGGRVV